MQRSLEPSEEDSDYSYIAALDMANNLWHSCNRVSPTGWRRVRWPQAPHLRSNVQQRGLRLVLDASTERFVMYVCTRVIIVTTMKIIP